MKDLVTIIGPKGLTKQVLRKLATSREITALGYVIQEDVIPRPSPLAKAAPRRVSQPEPVAEPQQTQPVTYEAPSVSLTVTDDPSPKKRIKTTD